MSSTNLEALSTDIPLLIMRDEAGALGKVAQKFHDENIDVEAIRFLKRNSDSGYALVAMKVEMNSAVETIIGDFLVERQVDLK